MQRTITRKRLRTVGHEDFKEATTLNGQIKRVACLHQVPLREQTLRRNDTSTRTDLKSRGQHGVLRGLRPRLSDVLIQQVLENGTAPLEAIGADVREVIRNSGHLGLLCIQSGFGNPQ